MKSYATVLISRLRESEDFALMMVQGSVLCFVYTRWHELLSL